MVYRADWTATVPSLARTSSVGGAVVVVVAQPTSKRSGMASYPIRLFFRIGMERADPIDWLALPGVPLDMPPPVSCFGGAHGEIAALMEFDGFIT